MNGLLQADESRRGLVLDPRTKLFIMLTVVVFVVGGFGSLSSKAVVALAIFPLVLLVLSGEWKKVLIYGLVFALAEAYLYFGTKYVPSSVGVILVMTCVIVTRILPGLIMGAYIFSTTTVSEFIASMDRMHITKKISIPLAIMFRFFPTVMEEFVAINNAMKMRDIRLGGKNAGKIVEYRLVPLIICSINIGTELSAASLTRGLSAEEKRTNICKIGFHIQDILIFLAMIMPFVYAIGKLLGGNL